METKTNEQTKKSDVSLVYPQQDEEGYLESPLTSTPDENILMLNLGILVLCLYCLEFY